MYAGMSGRKEVRREARKGEGGGSGSGVVAGRGVVIIPLGRGETGEPIIKLFRPRLTLGRGGWRGGRERGRRGVGGEVAAIGQLTSALENNEASRVTSNLALAL